MKNFPYMVLLSSLLLSACGQEEPRLPGKRLDVRDPLVIEGEEAAQEIAAAANIIEPIETNPREAVSGSQPISLPGTVNHTNWTHRGGSADHKVTHPALSRGLTRVWSANVGAGNSRRYRISGDPIIAEGRVFAQDARATVAAFSTSGAALWSRDLTPASDRNKDATGGGLAFGNGILFATTGFGELEIGRAHV